ncbi:hypothetical protein [Mycobacterium lepromatosis]|uniref:hypothetical protein n=1 Tax=Mycobacterium lepromatosis TaxID=480418 RepID=UPI003D805186
MVSDALGPQSWLSILGCEVRAMYPFGPIFLRCRSQRHRDVLERQLRCGLISCPELLPALWEMANESSIGLEELRPAI